VAWSHLGWDHAFCAEIDPFASAVLAHRFPSVPNLGDLTKIGAERGPVDLLCGGTPCQSFSVAGRRAGLDDARGVLAFEFLRLAERVRARWLVFENVPGLLSIDGGRAFGAFLGALAGLGYGFAYRVLDAQWFGLAQRRARVFVVARLGDWRGPVAVLLEPEGLRGDSAPGRAEGEGVAPTLANRARGGGGLGTDAECDGALIPVMAAGAHGANGAGIGVAGDPAFTLDTTGAGAVAHSLRAVRKAAQGARLLLGALSAVQDARRSACGESAAPRSRVRRFVVEETEALQGFPRGWTMIPYRGKPAKDGPRYRAVGNAMAVPVVRWIGERIALFEEANR
jgi:DNA (cytosine-5)-methyltransferase 1